MKMIFVRGAMLFLVSLAATLPARADLIDTAIEVINPDLAPARPLIDCVVIEGGSVKECAIAQGKAELEKNEDIQRIIEVYHLAKDKKYADLVAMLGVTVACTAFDVPGSSLVCNEFGKKVAEYGAKAVKLAAKIHEDLGKKVIETAKKLGKTIGCVTHIYCKSEDEKDPNKFYWTVGGTTLSMTKFDLGAMWANEYAPRVGEGVQARLYDIAKLQRMIAVPPPHLTESLAPVSAVIGKVGSAVGGSGGPGASPFGGAPPKKPKPLASKYLLSSDALAFESMNQATKAWHAVGVEGGLVNIHLGVFDPFEREMNARWLELVNAAAADMIEDTGDRYLKDKKNWLTLAMPKISFDNFEKTLAPGWEKEPLAGCRKTIEVSGALMRRWALGASAAQDKNKVEGHSASDWLGLTTGLTNWCSNRLGEDMAGRLKERDAAISWGCVPKPAGLRGLDCPAKATAKKTKPSGDPSNWSPIPKGEVEVVPIELCRNAYELYGKTDPKYCSLMAGRETGLPGLMPRAPAVPPASEPSGRMPSASEPAERTAPPGLVPPVRRLPPVEPQKSTLCRFTAGPRAGEMQDYAPMAPIPVGSNCHDGRGSTGVVVAN